MSYQKLERLDSKGKVISRGVVNKHSPLTSSQNDGIYDVIAGNLEALKDELDNFQINITKEDVQAVITAKEQMKEQVNKSLALVRNAQATAKSEAARAVNAADRAEESYNKVKNVADSASGQIDQMKSLIEAMSNFTEAFRALTGMDSLSDGKVGTAVTFHDPDHKPLSSIRTDEDGDFYFSGKIHGDLLGRVDHATHADDAGRLASPVKINGVPFDGSSSINVDAGLMEKKRIEVTLKEGLWEGDRTYTIENDFIKADTDIIFMPQVGTSAIVYSKISEACIVCQEQEDGYIVLKCLGDPPSQDVNVELLLL